MIDAVRFHVEPPGARDRSSALLFSIVFKGRLGENLWRFTRDVMAYALPVEAYALLIHDQFPSFSLTADIHDAVLARQS